MLKRAFIESTWQRAAIWAAVAGVAYYSWPLGYVLNPLAGRRGLASDLEATGQPYNWLFIMLDIFSGLLIVLVAWWLAKFWKHNNRMAIKLILWGYAAFGLLTAVDAILPMNCLVDVNRCGPLLSNPMIVLHGIASIGSIIGLTMSVVGIWQLIVMTYRSPLHLRMFLHVMLLVWLGFGVLTLVLVLSRRSSNAAQHIFITICSLWTAVVPYMLVHFDRREMALATLVTEEVDTT